jgi:hypothetical protein
VTADDILRLLSGFPLAGGAVGATWLAILVLGSRGAWYYGGIVADIMKDRDDWKAIALSATATMKEQAAQNASLVEITEVLSRK